MFAKLLSWLSVGDYRAENKRSESQIVARFSRGNGRAQIGDFLAQNDLERVVLTGDRFIDALDRRVVRK